MNILILSAQWSTVPSASVCTSQTPHSVRNVHCSSECIMCYMLDACASSAFVHASQRTHMVTMATILMSPSAYLTENTVTMVTMAMKCHSLTSSMSAIHHPTPFP